MDLKELFGVPLTGSEALKQKIGQAMIDKIIQRTESHKDVNGSKFAAYSKEYVDSLQFKAFDKTKSDINMKLTGQMLSTLDITADKGSKITIGWDDEQENAKAYNHNVGDTVTKREFFGLTDQELQEIKAEFKDDVKSAAGEPLQSEKNQVLSGVIRSINKRTFGGSNG